VTRERVTRGGRIRGGFEVTQEAKLLRYIYMSVALRILAVALNQSLPPPTLFPVN